MCHGCDQVVLYASSRAGEAIRAKEVSPVEVVDAVVARIEQPNPAQRLLHRHGRSPRAPRRKPRPLSCGRGPGGAARTDIDQDLIATKGVRTTHGSKLYGNLSPTRTRPSSEHKRAGAIILGKTNTPGIRAQSDHRQSDFRAEPQPLEPWAPPGGSSGGAAAVATGLGPLAVGTDAGIDSHSVELLCDFRAETHAWAGGHGPNLWRAGDALAHGSDGPEPCAMLL